MSNPVTEDSAYVKRYAATSRSGRVAETWKDTCLRDSGRAPPAERRHVSAQDVAQVGLCALARGRRSIETNRWGRRGMALYRHAQCVIMWRGEKRRRT